MRNWRELAILIVLVTVIIRIWMPKGGKRIDVSAVKMSVASEQTIAGSTEAPNKRSKFADWGRNPFGWPQREQDAGDDSNVKLRAIMCRGEEVRAALNESIVRVGDRIAGRTVKRIEHNRVILTDGMKDYILEFRE